SRACRRRSAPSRPTDRCSSACWSASSGSSAASRFSRRSRSARWSSTWRCTPATCSDRGPAMTVRAQRLSLLDPGILVPAIGESFRKLDPRTLFRNPVMFVVELVALVTTILFLRDAFAAGGGHFDNAAFSGQITLWLWVTVLFANFAE